MKKRKGPFEPNWLGLGKDLWQLLARRYLDWPCMVVLTSTCFQLRKWIVPVAACPMPLSNRCQYFISVCQRSGYGALLLWYYGFCKDPSVKNRNVRLARAGCVESFKKMEVSPNSYYALFDDAFQYERVLMCKHLLQHGLPLFPWNYTLGKWNNTKALRPNPLFLLLFARVGMKVQICAFIERAKSCKWTKEEREILQFVIDRANQCFSFKELRHFKSNQLEGP